MLYIICLRYFSNSLTLSLSSRLAHTHPSLMMRVLLPYLLGLFVSSEYIYHRIYLFDSFVSPVRLIRLVASYLYDLHQYVYFRSDASGRCCTDIILSPIVSIVFNVLRKSSTSTNSRDPLLPLLC